MRKQLTRLDGILTALRRTRSMFLAGIELPAGFKFVKSNDESGNCGVCFLIQAENVSQAERIEAIVGKYLSVHRPINSGRHVYSTWDVINSRVGGHHRDWDCFRHPKNKNIKTNYRQPLRQTDDYLKRTVLCSTPYEWTKEKIGKTIARINRGLARMSRS